jgi:hypothetical protein
MTTPVVGVFANRADAERAVDELVRSGFSLEQIGVVRGDQPVHSRERFNGSQKGG